MTTDDQDRKAGRIVVDEDWKAQVQAEKEAAAAAQQIPQAQPDPPADTQPPTDALPAKNSLPPTESQPADSQAAAAVESVESARSARSPGSEKPMESRPQRPFQVPSASFSVLVSSLAAQAMAALESSLAGPKDSDKAEQRAVQPELARHFIDTLGILETKTQGNLTDEEKLLLSNVLHELRMLFVTVKSKSG